MHLAGIDAPELEQRCTRGGISWRCGMHAARALEEFVGRNRVFCRSANSPPERPWTGRCTMRGLDLGAEMIGSGLAVAFPDRSRTYFLQQVEARTTSRGLWGGPFMRPSAWRRLHGIPGDP